MRIALLITGLDYGGAETQVVHLASLLRSRGHDIHIISMLTPSGYADELIAAGFPVRSLGMGRGVADPRAVVRLAVLLRRIRPDVLHSHMVHANLLARLTRPLSRVPVLICSASSIDEGGRAREIAYRLTDRLCDLTTNVSEVCVERYIKVGASPRGRIRAVSCGVDTTKFRPMPPDTRRKLRQAFELNGSFTWLAVGRLTAAKDYPTLIRAFAEVVKEHPDALLLLRGEGEMEREIKDLVASLGLDESVRLMIPRSDIPSLMNAADAYVMSSAWEGMPGVLLEASSCEMPIVATDVGGNREVVLDGINGYIVPPGDPRVLSQAMVRMMSQTEDQRAEMGNAGLKHVESEYAFDRIASQWEAIYREMSERGRGAK